MERKEVEVAVLTAALHAAGIEALCRCADGSVAVSTIESPQLERGVLAFLEDRAVPLGDGGRAVMGRDGKRYALACRLLDAPEPGLEVITVRELRDAASHEGIAWYNADEVRDRCRLDAFGVVETDQEVAPAVMDAHARGAMILLEGEAGTGKLATAELVYLDGPFANRPLVAVACDGIPDKTWRYLLKSQDSPLYQADLTILLCDIQALEERRVRELVTAIRSSSLSRRSRVMFTADDVPTGGESPQAVYVAEGLACAVCVVPSVRDRGGAAQKVEAYLRFLATSFETDAPRLEPAAADVLNAYRWPRNYLQLREVAERLYIMVGPGTIDAPLAQEVLEQEGVIRTATFSAPTLDTDLYIYRPLADTERDIARLVVGRLGGNKTRAAEVLGISRTTLWRLLKDPAP